MSTTDRPAPGFCDELGRLWALLTGGLETAFRDLATRAADLSPAEAFAALRALSEHVGAKGRPDQLPQEASDKAAALAAVGAYLGDRVAELAHGVLAAVGKALDAGHNVEGDDTLIRAADVGGVRFSAPMFSRTMLGAPAAGVLAGIPGIEVGGLAGPHVVLGPAPDHPGGPFLTRLGRVKELTAVVVEQEQRAKAAREHAEAMEKERRRVAWEESEAGMRERIRLQAETVRRLEAEVAMLKAGKP